MKIFFITSLPCISNDFTGPFRPNEAVKGSRERIIPIAFEKQEPTAQEKVQSPPVKPPVPKHFQSQMSSTSQT